MTSQKSRRPTSKINKSSNLSSRELLNTMIQKKQEEINESDIKFDYLSNLPFKESIKINPNDSKQVILGSNSSNGNSYDDLKDRIGDFQSIYYVPIIYGNISIKQEDKFLWTLYLRHAKDPHYSFPFISHVVFNLHESFRDKSTIILSKAPYEVTMKGWGEFEAEILIYSKEISTLTNINLQKTPSCKLTHIVKLFGKSENVISEVCDELLVRGDLLPIENDIHNTPLSIDPIRNRILPIILKSEFTKYSIENLDLILQNEIQRYKSLERIRLEMIRDCRKRIDIEIQNIEKNLQST